MKNMKQSFEANVAAAQKEESESETAYQEIGEMLMPSQRKVLNAFVQAPEDYMGFRPTVWPAERGLLRLAVGCDLQRNLHGGKWQGGRISTRSPFQKWYHFSWQ